MMKTVKCFRASLMSLVIVGVAFTAHGQGPEMRWHPEAGCTTHVCNVGSPEVPCECLIEGVMPGTVSVTLNLRLSDWGDAVGSANLAAYWATINATSGYSSGDGCDLGPLGGVGDPAGAFIDPTHPQFVFHPSVIPPPCMALPAVSIPPPPVPDYGIGASVLGGCSAPDPEGSDGVPSLNPQYGGTLIIEVPPCAAGTYTIPFVQMHTQTYMKDAFGELILPLNLTPVVIGIPVGRCCYNLFSGDCVDGISETECATYPGPRIFSEGATCADPCPECMVSADCEDPYDPGPPEENPNGGVCTDQECIDFLCYYTDLYDPLVYCCDPVTGDLTSIDDSNECTQDICNGDGWVDHNPLTGTPCTHSDLCVISDICDAGVCVGDLPEDLNIFCLEDIDCPVGWFCDRPNFRCDCAAGDCDGDGIPDPCELDCIAFGGVCDVPGCGEEVDCNSNRIPDDCDIDPNDPDGNGQVSNDYNDNGVPGECEQECADMPPDMRAWWPLDEPMGLIAYDIIGGQHGTHAPLDGPTPVPDGKVAGALSFDGVDDYVEVRDHGSLDFGMGDGTIDAWIRTDADDGTIVTKGSWLWYYFKMVDGNLWFGICDEAACWMPAESMWVAPLNDGTWHHVAATLSRQVLGDVTLAVYIDGSLCGETYLAAPIGYIGSAEQELLIGASPSVPGYLYELFDGDIDEVEIFNRALDQAEIQAIYEAGSAGKCKCVDPPADVVAWWPLDELEEPIAHDIVGGKDGTHINEPAPVLDGMVEGALGFDGIDDYVEGLDDGSLDFGMGEGTVDTWIKTTDEDGGTIFVKGSCWWSYWFWMWPEGYLDFSICDDAYCYIPVQTAQTVNDGNWHHVAATVSRHAGGEVTLDIYLDGVWRATTYIPDPVGYIGGLDQELLIGAHYCTPGALHEMWLFDGLIDEVEIFNRALDAEEIEAIYQAGSAGKCRPPDVEIEPVARRVESGIDITGTLPDSDSAVTAGDSFVVELWATDSGVENTGLVGAYVDLRFDPDVVQVLSVDHREPFTFLADGVIDNVAGMVTDLGGIDDGFTCVGVEPQWIRLAVVELEALGTLAAATFITDPSPLEIGACYRGTVLPELVSWGTAAVEIEHNVYDLTGDCFIDAGDLGLFAPCWGCCEPDPCWEPNTCEDKDFDCSGCVAAGDIGWFAAGWMKACDEIPREDWPPCRRPGRGAARQETLDDGEVLIRWGTVASGQGSSLKSRRSDVGPRAGDQFAIQLWVRDDTADSRGLAAVYVDVTFDPSQVIVDHIDHGPTYATLASGEIGERSISRLGGATLEPDVAVGEWMHFASVRMTARLDLPRGPKLKVQPAYDGVAGLGRGTIPDEQIRLIAMQGFTVSDELSWPSR